MSHVLPRCDRAGCITPAMLRLTDRRVLCLDHYTAELPDDPRVVSLLERRLAKSLEQHGGGAA